MKKTISLVLIAASFISASCARQMGSNEYVSANSVGVVLEGVVVSSRQVTIREKDKLQDNQAGLLGGAVVGGVGANNIGKGRGRTAATVGGALLGAALGAALEDQLSQQQGMEYIVSVKTDEVQTNDINRNYSFKNNTVAQNLKDNIQTGTYKTKLISVVQGMDQIFNPGQKVYVVYNDDNRARLTPAF